MTAAQTEPLVEAIACWRLALPGSRELLTSTAADLVAQGVDGAALLEMASVYPDENAFRIDALVDDVIAELSLEPDLSHGLDVPATRWMARSVVRGSLRERELSRWAHSRFHHESDSELLNELAELDDQYDDAAYAETSTESIRSRIRDVAQQILGDR
jgi:hypothetical protein